MEGSQVVPGQRPLCNPVVRLRRCESHALRPGRPGHGWSRTRSARRLAADVFNSHRSCHVPETGGMAKLGRHEKIQRKETLPAPPLLSPSSLEEEEEEVVDDRPAVCINSHLQ